MEHRTAEDVLRRPGKFVIVEEDEVPAGLLGDFDRALTRRAADRQYDVGATRIQAAAQIGRLRRVVPVAEHADIELERRIDRLQPLREAGDDHLVHHGIVLADDHAYLLVRVGSFHAGDRDEARKVAGHIALLELIVECAVGVGIAREIAVEADEFLLREAL